jgi:hypothetical protein
MPPTTRPAAPPEHVHDLAEGCVRFVERTLGITLDYAPETLPLVDHWLRAGGPREKAEVLELAAPAAGAYFGEVIRRTLGDARWYAPPGEPAEWRLEYEHVFLSFNPIGVAIEAALGRHVEGWSAHFQMLPGDRQTIEEGLERTSGSVREDDFFRLAVRYEVVEQIVETLRALALARKEDDRFYGPDLYAASVADTGPALLH